jgi:iron complex outermembrane receptor protein
MSLALPALGQDNGGEEARGAAPAIKVFVTGSNIPTVERETALPVQVITREQIERTNLRTAAELVNRISATTSYSAFNETQGGGDPGGAGFAGGALRGLGFQFTVVLVNGRRIAPYAFAPRGGDLNAIPLAAVDRVEVLKDGASAIYGSDAIGGVINFILRNDFHGAQVSAQYTAPEHTGGYGKQLTSWIGVGDLAAQGFNAYATFDYQKYGGVSARDRSFAARSYIPEEGINRTEIESMPANVDTPQGPRNPTGDPNQGYRSPLCAPPLSSSLPGNEYQCRWFGDGSSSIVDASERINIVGSFTWQFDPHHRFFLYDTWARSRFTYLAGPTAVSSQTSQDGGGFLLPSTSAFYPHAFARAFGIDGAPLNVYWRADELGARRSEPTTEQQNIVAGMQGIAWGWRYDGAFDYSRSDVDARYAGGFVRQSLLLPILNSGIVNPFDRNTPDVVARLSAAKVDAVLGRGTSSVASLNFHTTKEVFDLPAGWLSVALGFDLLQEKLTIVADPVLAFGDVLEAQPFRSLSGSRNVWAAFAETSIPMSESLEANLAVRHDRYSDFGSTTNPKVSARWQPLPALLLRASAGTGFLAPSLQGIFSPSAVGLLPERHDDAARCPFTFSLQDCDRRFPARFGGNPALQPVTSRQWSAGGVWSASRDFSVGVDYVSIALDDRINFFSSTQIFDQCADGVTGRTCHLIHRGPADPGHPELPGPIVQVDQFVTNLGRKKVSALDLDVRFVATRQNWGQVSVGFNGTYNIKYLEQQVDGSYVDLAGTYSTSGGNPGVVPRWRHYLVAGWSYGAWSATLAESYQTGTNDQLPAAQPRRMGDYDVWELSFAYATSREVTVSGGIRNLFDRDPPFSNQSQTVQIGYDPSYADPRGRLYWAGIRYTFR